MPSLCSLWPKKKIFFPNPYYRPLLPCSAIIRMSSPGSSKGFIHNKISHNYADNPSAPPANEFLLETDLNESSAEAPPSYDAVLAQNSTQSFDPYSRNDISFINEPQPSAPQLEHEIDSSQPGNSSQNPFYHENHPFFHGIHHHKQQLKDQFREQQRQFKEQHRQYKEHQRQRKQQQKQQKQQQQQQQQQQHRQQHQQQQQKQLQQQQQQRQQQQQQLQFQQQQNELQPQQPGAQNPDESTTNFNLPPHPFQFMPRPPLVFPPHHPYANSPWFSHSDSASFPIGQHPWTMDPATRGLRGGGPFRGGFFDRGRGNFFHGRGFFHGRDRYNPQDAGSCMCNTSDHSKTNPLCPLNNPNRHATLPHPQNIRIYGSMVNSPERSDVSSNELQDHLRALHTNDGEEVIDEGRAVYFTSEDEEYLDEDVPLLHEPWTSRKFPTAALLFLLGWVFPPIWFFGICYLKNPSPFERFWAKGNLYMSVLSILGVAIGMAVGIHIYYHEGEGIGYLRRLFMGDDIDNGDFINTIPLHIPSNI